MGKGEPWKTKNTMRWMARRRAVWRVTSRRERAEEISSCGGAGARETSYPPSAYATVVSSSAAETESTTRWWCRGKREGKQKLALLYPLGGHILSEYYWMKGCLSW